MNYILTFDYELNGDGTGDMFLDVINPMQEILDICDEKEIKITIFFEILEYLEIEREWNKGNKMGYTNNPIIEINNQLQNAYKNGHDVQLHLHPQWIDSKFEKGSWKLDMSNWRLGDYNPKKQLSLVGMLRKGKESIEQIIRIVDPEYQCIALRAGGYNIMPSNKIYNAMKEVGLYVDSSIFPGGYEDSELSKFDYRYVSNQNDYWFVSPKDFRIKSLNKKEIIEIPIFSISILRILKHINLENLILRYFKKGLKLSANSKAKLKFSLFDKLKYFFTYESYTWDVTMFSKMMHKRFFKFIFNKIQKKRNIFVLIGHPKSLLQAKTFRDFFTVLDKYDKNPNFSTVKLIYYEIQNMNNGNKRC